MFGEEDGLAEFTLFTQFAFDQTFYPPLPVCEFRLRTSTGQESELLTGILDTGADATIIPTRVLQQINARRSFESTLRSQWGERRRVFLYLVDIQIAQILLPSIYAVGDEQGDEIVIGRDVLNRLRIGLDGPKGMTSITP